MIKVGSKVMLDITYQKKLYEIEAVVKKVTRQNATVYVDFLKKDFSFPLNSLRKI